MCAGRAGWIGVDWSHKSLVPSSLPFVSLVHNNNRGKGWRDRDQGQKNLSVLHESLDEYIQSIYSCSFIVEWHCKMHQTPDHEYRTLKKDYFFWFQVVKRAVIMSFLMAGLGGAFTLMRVLKKDMKLFWEVFCLFITPWKFLLRELFSWPVSLCILIHRQFQSIAGLNNNCFIAVIKSLMAICLFSCTS